jgi:polyisoprenoid-binding protein YceI
MEAPSSIVGVEQASDRRRCFPVAPQAPNVSDQRLVLDRGNTRISFEVRWFGVLPIRGTFGRLHGTLEIEGGVAQARVQIDVDAASVKTGLALRDRHLRRQRFLHSDLYPFISFKSVSTGYDQGHLVVDGVLSLRGIEVNVRSTCPVETRATGGTTVDLCGRFDVSRRQFGIGMPRGLAARNPLFLAISDRIQLNVLINVPARLLAPVLVATPAAASQ